MFGWDQGVVHQIATSRTEHALFQHEHVRELRGLQEPNRPLTIVPVLGASSIGEPFDFDLVLCAGTEARLGLTGKSVSVRMSSGCLRMSACRHRALSTQGSKAGATLTTAQILPRGIELVANYSRLGRVWRLEERARRYSSRFPPE